MTRYFFDFRSLDIISSDEEGVDLPNAAAAHDEAVAALAEAIRDSGLKGTTAERFTVEVRDDIGPVLGAIAVLESRIYRKN